MSTIETRDGTKIFYKEGGKGQPVVFCHGWPLSADTWDSQLQFFADHGYRVIAHDRRSHGRSDQTWDGNDMDHYADDLADLLDALDVTGATLIGHSTGGGEVAHYIGRHGTSRVAKAVLMSAVPPLMVKTPQNPNGTPKEVFDGIRKGVFDNRSQLYKDITLPFYGYNRPGATISEGARESFWLQGMMGGQKGQYDCVYEFSEVDYTEDLKAMTMPTLVLQGDDDQIVPIVASGRRSVEILPDATLKVYPGAPHGVYTTHQDEVNADLLAFVKG